MLEMGQPLHAFDFRFLEEGRIFVRNLKKMKELFLSTVKAVHFPPTRY